MIDELVLVHIIEDECDVVELLRHTLPMVNLDELTLITVILGVLIIPIPGRPGRPEFKFVDSLGKPMP